METAADSKGAAAEQSLTNFVISPVSGTWGQENSSDRKPFKAIKSAYPKHNEPLKVCALEYLYAGSLARPRIDYSNPISFGWSYLCSCCSRGEYDETKRQTPTRKPGPKPGSVRINSAYLYARFLLSASLRLTFTVLCRYAGTDSSLPSPSLLLAPSPLSPRHLN